MEFQDNLKHNKYAMRDAFINIMVSKHRKSPFPYPVGAEVVIEESEDEKKRPSSGTTRR